MQFKIPQNIDIEEKILPFLTIKQLFILLGGGAVAYLIYIASVGRYDPSIYLIPVILIVVVTVLIAFFKMENITFIKLVLLMMESLINPRTRVWFHYAEPLSPLDEYDILLQLEQEGTKKSPQPVQNQNDLLHNLENLTQVVDTSQNFLSEKPTYQDERPSS
ncbi:MAG: PrgI family protein [Candidatus Gracilibacteria bacterium]